MHILSLACNLQQPFFNHRKEKNDPRYIIKYIMTNRHEFTGPGNSNKRFTTDCASGQSVCVCGGGGVVVTVQKDGLCCVSVAFPGHSTMFFEDTQATS